MDTDVQVAHTFISLWNIMLSYSLLLIHGLCGDMLCIVMHWLSLFQEPKKKMCRWHQNPTVSGMQVSMQGGRVLEMCGRNAGRICLAVLCVSVWSHWQVGGMAGGGRRGCRQ